MQRNFLEKEDHFKAIKKPLIKEMDDYKSSLGRKDTEIEQIYQETVHNKNYTKQKNKKIMEIKKELVQRNSVLEEEVNKLKTSMAYDNSNLKAKLLLKD